MPTTNVTELEEHRLELDLTYQELADVIEAKTQHRRDADCWRRICLGLTPRPHKRTLAILEKYLKAARPRRRKPS